MYSFDGYKSVDQYGDWIPEDLVVLSLSRTEANLLETNGFLKIKNSTWYEVDGCLFISNKTLPDCIESNPSPREYFKDNKIRRVNRVDDVLKRWDEDETNTIFFYHA